MPNHRPDVRSATAPAGHDDVPMNRSHDTRARAAAGLIVVAVSLASLVATLPDIGLTDDADAHLSASINYAQWTARVLSGDLTALRRDQVDRYWQVNAEHPPLAKLVMGAGWWLFHFKLGWTDEVTAARLGTVAFSTMLVWLVFLFSWDYVGRLAALAAPLFLLTVPSFFFHSHVEAFDVAVAATSFLTFFAFVRSLAMNSTPWAVASGVAFGLALLTKLNAPFFLVSFAIFPFVARSSRARVEDGRLPRTPLALPLMVVLGPLMFLALWPWMWFDTYARLVEYVRFHLHHYGILFLYFGQIYDQGPAPWHAPLVMTAITTPVVPLALSATAGVAILRSSDRSFRRDLGVLLLLAAAAAIVPTALPGVPKYAGVKLFLPLFPFLAVLAAWSIERAAAWLRARATVLRLPAPWIGPALVAAAVLPGAVSVTRIHPYELSYYNELVGGLPGAVRAGFERQYYDLIYVEMIDWFNRTLPRGARITFLPNNIEYPRNGRWWFRDGLIRNDLQFVDLNQAQVLVLTHERRWPQYPALAAQYAGLPLLWQLEVEGVPLLTVYRLHGH